MPIGALSTLVPVIRSLLMTNPATVLDLGIGFGINGCGVRNWLDLGTHPYRTTLVGVEGFEKYRNPAWDLYNEVYVGKIQDFLQEDKRTWKAIVMTDVIEHFTKEEGLAVIEQCKARLEKRGVLLIVTPAVFFEQGAYAGNELEIHKSLWTGQDFEGLGFYLIQDGSIDAYGYKMLVAEYIKNHD